MRIATASNFEPTSAVEIGEACRDTVPSYAGNWVMTE
ncbi:hypothetical protein ACVME5_004488 [Bradyrhizobium liaoningense]